jgi:hypothetical protein
MSNPDPQTIVEFVRPEDGCSLDDKDRFDMLYSQWLVARGRAIGSAIGGNRIEENARDNDAATDALWAMIRARAKQPYQIRSKLEALRDSTDDGGGWVDGREGALIASIDRDLQGS